MRAADSVDAVDSAYIKCVAENFVEDIVESFAGNVAEDTVGSLGEAVAEDQQALSLCGSAVPWEPGHGRKQQAETGSACYSTVAGTLEYEAGMVEEHLSV